jgi:dienelactone hydrolase
MRKPRIEIIPDKVVVDERVNIKLSGFEPYQLVTLRAADSGMPGGILEAVAYAVFQTDAEGKVDTASQAPLSGTYDEADPMGLFWSMEIKKLAFHHSSKLDQLHFAPATAIVTLTAEVNGEIVAKAELTRLFVTPEVKIVNVLENGLVGRFFFNTDLSQRPAIIVLCGSEGGLAASSQFSALFASRGYPALALAYFQLEHLPDDIRNIPLEYFQTAIDWLKRQNSVAPDKISVFGRSKGAELGLVLGATFPDIRAVTASSPSSVVCIGSMTDSKDATSYNPQSSWSFRGEPLPFVKWTEQQCLEAMNNLREGKRIDHIHEAGLNDKEMAERAAIPIEKINGPILLISSDDDHWWPAALHCQRMMARLKEHRFPHKCIHLNYTNTGHGIRFPYIPATRLQFNGGTAKNNAYASEHSWRCILRFLKESLE